jgi:pimeloyl-ACP methyl ester carboxylesterase
MIPKAGHAPFEEEPDVFLAILNDFLKRSSATAALG